MKNPEIAIDKSRIDKIETGKISLDEIIKKIGYKEVFTIEELELSQEEKKQTKNLIDLGDRVRFFIAERADGAKVKAMIFEGEKTFDANIFSPFGYKGHLFCNDFSSNEIEEALEDAKNRNEKGNPISEQEKINTNN